jgi:secreted trypsin-like serine protease
MKSNLFSFVLALCPLTHPAWAGKYIVGGETVGPRDKVATSTVGIFSPSGDGKTGALCSGTLISKDIALTAAHCVSPDSKNTEVIFHPDMHSSGAIQRSADAVKVDSKWRTHAGKGMDQGDIALVKFHGQAPQGYQPAPMVGDEKEIRKGEKVILAGYGITNAATKTGAGRLRKTEVSIADNRPGKSEMILDQSHGHGACHGDSGGPAFLRKGKKLEVAGLTNRSYPSGAPDDCREQVVYTKVPAYKKWIQTNEQKLDGGSVKRVSDHSRSSFGRHGFKVKREPRSHRPVLNRAHHFR